MTRRILIIIGIAILFVITVPAGLLYYAAYTEPGLRFIVSHIPTTIGRTEMEFVGPRGTLAGGFTRFANPNRIIIIRKDARGERRIPFDYSAVIEKGDLQQNLALQAGDTVVVP